MDMATEMDGVVCTGGINWTWYESKDRALLNEFCRRKFGWDEKTFDEECDLCHSGRYGIRVHN